MQQLWLLLCVGTLEQKGLQLWEAKMEKVEGIKWYYWSVIEEGLPGRTYSDRVKNEALTKTLGVGELLPRFPWLSDE